MLGGASTAGGELPDVIEEDGTLQGVELRGVVGDLGEEGIGHEDVGFVLMAIVAISEEDGDVDLEGAGEAIEGREGRHGLPVLDLRDVGARDAHARGELTLGEVADVAEVTNGTGDLEGSIGRGGCRNEREGRRGGDWHLDFQTLLASPAECAGGAELDEAAMVTA